MEILVSSDCGGRYIISSPGCRQWGENLDLTGVLQDTAGENSIKGVILDLNDVNFINSSGLGAIFTLRKYIKAIEAVLVLARPTPNISRLLETANIPALIPVAENIEHAREIISSN